MAAPGYIPMWLGQKLPWILQAMQLFWQFDQEIELHEILQQLGKQGQPPTGGEPQGSPLDEVGSAQWIENMEHLENALAALDDEDECERWERIQIERAHTCP